MTPDASLPAKISKTSGAGVISNNHMQNMIKILGVAGLAVATLSAVSVSKAQPYAIAGDFNGWNNNGTISPGGGPTAYTNIMTGGTPGNFEGVKFIGSPGNWSPTYPSGNLEIAYDANGQNTVYFYPGSFTDGWLPLENRVGFADPGNMSFEITGDFTTPNWDTDPKAQMALQGNGVYTNTYIIASPGTHQFKIRTPGTWSDFNCGTDFSGGNPQNGTITTTNANQAVLFELDLPNGRWLAGTLAPPPVTNQVTFAVDMTAQLALGNFNPAADTVYVSGSFNGWPGTGTGALVLSNTPTYNGGSNTNIYYATAFVTNLPNSNFQFKFTCSDAAYSGNSGYEPVANNRGFSLLATNGAVSLAVVKFGDVSVSDYLTTPVNVTFTVNMAGAVSYPDGHAFDPSSDAVFLNGNFLPGGWAAWNPIALIQMQNNPVGSEIYTYTATVPASSLIKLDYKYGMYYSAATNYDNEAKAYSDHFRYIRVTGTGNYVNPTDTYGNQYSEPSFGQLASASAGAGSVAVSWLGRPGVQLQVCTNLLKGWQNIAETDGTNWVTGNAATTNGFVSQTNVPAISGSQFFRLQQAW
jgi:hypothetical protein